MMGPNFLQTCNTRTTSSDEIILHVDLYLNFCAGFRASRARAECLQIIKKTKSDQTCESSQKSKKTEKLRSTTLHSAALPQTHRALRFLVVRLGASSAHCFAGDIVRDTAARLVVPPDEELRAVPVLVATSSSL